MSYKGNIMSAGWIKKLNESNSKLHKEDVFKQAYESAILGSKNADTFLTLVNMCYDPMITFGVKQMPATNGIVDAENPWSDFILLLDKLRLRELTGHSARDAIIEMSLRFDSEEWDLMCVAVLRKDLRCGISDKTFNKVCKNTKYEIPVFACQLATNCEGRPEMKGKMRLEPKLDGVRVLMHCVWDTTTFTPYVESFSRNGKLFNNFENIEIQIGNQLENIHKLIGHSDFFLDGEVVDKSFNQLMRAVHTKDGKQLAANSVFHVFDIIPFDDLKRGHWNPQLYKRLDLLDKFNNIIDSCIPNVKRVEHIMVDLDTDSGRTKMKKYAQDCVKDGYEGIMIKNLGAPYECKRNKFWMKWKPKISVDLTIVGFELGKSTGKNHDRLGSFVCEGEDDGKFIRTNVGGGFSDVERQEYWDARESLMGRVVEVEADTVSQDKTGEYSLRFAEFVRFRDSFTGEKE
jgi:DNA ligase-1